ncbi:MAG: hypothetical protein LRZ88_10755 [Candidatus Cloacimonetes bacterium]|nr:hypothetical protein [Candidatus Cloacimonadota bacterium]
MKQLSLILILLSAIVLFAETFPVPVGAFAPLSYTAFRPIDEIVMDGDFDEISWQKSGLDRGLCGYRRRSQTQALSPHTGEDALGR